MISTLRNIFVKRPKYPLHEDDECEYCVVAYNKFGDAKVDQCGDIQNVVKSINEFREEEGYWRINIYKKIELSDLGLV